MPLSRPDFPTAFARPGLRRSAAAIALTALLLACGTAPDAPTAAQPREESPFRPAAAVALDAALARSLEAARGEGEPGAAEAAVKAAFKREAAALTGTAGLQVQAQRLPQGGLQVQAQAQIAGAREAFQAQQQVRWATSARRPGMRDAR